jgi:hypothetical protein
MEITITIKFENEELKNMVDTQDELTDNENTHVGPYAVWFNETCMAWTKDPESNKFFLLRQQDYANEKLKHNGYLFLNEVLDMIGAPRTKAGQVVGWIFDPKNPVGDNYVDFGLFGSHAKNFINGYERSVLLDFNPDGNILDRM